MKENVLKVGTLAEFYPRQSNLLGLNVNMGQKILLRLRSPHNECSFLSREQVMQTMIHELTHNLIGPHNNKFHKQMKSWCDRQYIIDTLGLKETFLGVGKRLGGSLVAARDIRLNRIQKLDAKKLGTVSGLNKSDSNYKTPRQLAMEAALQRLERSGRDKLTKPLPIDNRVTDTDLTVDVNEILSQHELMHSRQIIDLTIENENEDKRKTKNQGHNRRTHILNKNTKDNQGEKKNDIEFIDLTIG